jgi:hypothetical protein
MAQVLEHLPNKRKTLSSASSTTKKDATEYLNIDERKQQDFLLCALAINSKMFFLVLL